MKIKLSSISLPTPIIEEKIIKKQILIPKKVSKKIVKKRIKKRKKVQKKRVKQTRQVKQTPPKVKKRVLVTQNEIKKLLKNKEKKRKRESKQEKKVKEKHLETQYLRKHIDAIVLLLQENLYYPRSARKRGITGEIMVKFSLQPNGKIGFVKVISSQSDILSRAAVKTIRSLSGEFPRPQEKLILHLPIRYFLD